MSCTVICSYERLEPERGVAALVEGAQIAVFLTHDGQLHAIDNYDPYARAHVLSRERRWRREIFVRSLAASRPLGMTRPRAFEKNDKRSHLRTRAARRCQPFD